MKVTLELPDDTVFLSYTIAMQHGACAFGTFVDSFHPEDGSHRVVEETEKPGFLKAGYSDESI